MRPLLSTQFFPFLCTITPHGQAIVSRNKNGIQSTADTDSASLRFNDWGLTALSAQTGYIVPLRSMLQLKSEIIRRK